MRAWRTVFVCVAWMVVGACGGDDDASACDEAFDKWCACPDVTCDGHPESCSGPDKEWAECILAAEDVCTAECT